MHPGRERDVGAREIGRLPEDVGGETADRREKDFEIAARHQLREHAAGLLEQGSSQVGLGTAETPGHAGQIPDRLDGRLRHHGRAGAAQDPSVGAEAARVEGAPYLRHFDVRAGDRDRRSDVVPALDIVPIDVGHQRAERVEGDDTLRIGPLRMRTDGLGGGGVGEVGPMATVQRAGRDG